MTRWTVLPLWMLLCVALLGGCASRGELAGPAGTLVVLNKSEATASLLDLASGRELARLAVGVGPHEAATSPDGRTVVVSNYGAAVAGHTLSVIDVPQGRVVATITLDPLSRPHGLQFIDARRLLVSAEGQAGVLVVDVAARRVESLLRTEQRVAHMVAVTPDGARAFVANIGSGTLTALDLRTTRVLGHVATGTGAEGVDVSPDGAEVWVSNRGSDTLSVIDARSLQPLATLQAVGFPIRVRFDPAGVRAFVSVPRDDAVLVFERSTRALQRRIALPAAPVTTEGRLLGAFGRSTVPIGVVTDGTGRRLYVAQANADQVSEFDPADGRLLRVLPAGREPDGLAWTPVRVQAPAAAALPAKAQLP